MRTFLPFLRACPDHNKTINRMGKKGYQKTNIELIKTTGAWNTGGRFFEVTFQKQKPIR